MKFGSVYIAAIIALSACTDFPAIEARISPAEREAAFPQLTSIDGSLARSARIQTNGPARSAKIQSLSTRVAQLDARAKSLRGPIIEANRKSAMLAARARHALR